MFNFIFIVIVIYAFITFTKKPESNKSKNNRKVNYYPRSTSQFHPNDNNDGYDCNHHASHDDCNSSCDFDGGFDCGCGDD